MRFCGNKERDTIQVWVCGWGGGEVGWERGRYYGHLRDRPGLGNVVKTVKGLNPEVISSVV